MKLLRSIYLILFFLVFGLINCSYADDLCAPESNHPHMLQQVQENMVSGIELYTALPQKNFDNGFMPHVQNFKPVNSIQNFDLNNNKYKHSNYNTIVFLFKTEVFPNAP